jgi:FkbM family methyltransferase
MTLPEFLYTVVLRPPWLRRPANALLRSLIPRMLRVHGARIALHPNDPVISGALTLRCYEKEEIAFFLRTFRPAMRFVDVGANVGLYTGLALSRGAGGGRILAVEPDAENAHYLRQTIAWNLAPGDEDRVTVVEAAVTDRDGPVALHKNPDNKGDNRIYANELSSAAEEVPGKTLDQLCLQAGLAEIDFLKMDVQGAEGHVLEGAREILARSPRTILMMEFWPQGLQACGSSPGRVLELLGALGFRLHELQGAKLHPVLHPQDLIARCPGRAYCNLIGTKDGAL